MIDTKEKILESAERLFGQQGFAATSLRHIIADAGVNLAAIHYHFGSKEDLLDQLFERIAGPVNRARIEMLERFESGAAGEPLEVEQILEAFLAPAANVLSKLKVRLMGRLYGEGLMPTLVERHFKPTGKRFVAALRRTFPDLSDEEFFYRVDFMIGSMAHAMIRTPVLRADERPGGSSGSDDQANSIGARQLTCLIRFLAAGFKATAVLADQKVEALR